MNEGVQLVLTNLVKTAVLLVGGYLIKKGALDSATLQQATPSLVAGAIAVIVGGFATVYGALRQHIKFLTALEDSMKNQSLSKQSARFAHGDIVRRARTRPVNYAFNDAEDFGTDSGHPSAPHMRAWFIPAIACLTLMSFGTVALTGCESLKTAGSKVSTEIKSVQDWLSDPANQAEINRIASEAISLLGLLGKHGATTNTTVIGKLAQEHTTAPAGAITEIVKNPEKYKESSAKRLH